MKLIKKIRRIPLDWILIALAIGAIVSIIFIGPAMKPSFAMPGIAIHVGIVTAVFIAVFICGSLLEQKMAKRFQNELKGGEK